MIGKCVTILVWFGLITNTLSALCFNDDDDRFCVSARAFVFDLIRWFLFYLFCWFLVEPNQTTQHRRASTTTSPQTKHSDATRHSTRRRRQTLTRTHGGNKRTQTRQADTRRNNLARLISHLNWFSVCSSSLFWHFLRIFRCSYKRDLTSHTLRVTQHTHTHSRCFCYTVDAC